MVVLPHHVVLAVVHHRQLDPVGAGTATEAVIGPEQRILTTVGRGPVAGTALVMGTGGRQIEDKALDTTIIGDLYALHRNPLHHGGNQKICIPVEGINYAMGDRHLEVLIFWKGTEDNSDFLFLCYGLINSNFKVDVFNVKLELYISGRLPPSLQLENCVSVSFNLLFLFD